MASLSPAHEVVVSDGIRRIVIAPQVARDEPLVIDLDLGDPALATHTQLEVGANARVAVIERLHGRGSADTALRCEIAVGAGAQVTYTVVQTAEGTVAVDRRASVGADARFGWNLALLGSATTRESAIATLDAAGANAEVAALFFPVARETLELTTEVGHDVGMTSSTTVVRAIAAGRGRGRYFGNIRIAPHAHGSEASLRDDSLLFGSNAKIDAIPALEIAANDVRAFHGATAGSVDDEHLFYLMSRGITREDAEKLIALGFFSPALERFPGEALRDELRALLETKLAGVRA